jgi:predicted RNase H-like HicB family nuclease
VNIADHYTYRVRWSAEDDSYVATVAELPSLSWIMTDRAEAFEGIQRLAVEVVSDMLDQGDQPPEAIADRSYSGKFLVRVPPATFGSSRSSARRPAGAHPGAPTSKIYGPPLRAG